MKKGTKIAVGVGAGLTALGVAAFAISRATKGRTAYLNTTQTGTLDPGAVVDLKPMYMGADGAAYYDSAKRVLVVVARRGVKFKWGIARLTLAGANHLAALGKNVVKYYYSAICELDPPSKSFIDAHRCSGVNDYFTVADALDAARTKVSQVV